MDKIAEDIYDIIKDYNCDTTQSLQLKDITDWVNQFNEDDRLFVLSEFLHLLKQGIYVSKKRATDLVWQNFEKASLLLGYGKNLKTFVLETHFFNTQPEHKSQAILIKILGNLIQEKVGETINSNKDFPIKNYIFIDDIIGTGKTTMKFFREWLSQESNLSKVLLGEINCLISVFAHHTWAWSNIKWTLKLHFKSDEIMKRLTIISNYNIENQVKYPSSKLNLAYIKLNTSALASNYLNTLNSANHSELAYRKEGQPPIEMFYSSAENRDRFEKIILEMGIDILNKVKNANAFHRPLGATYPSYKTFGTGTLFFTWRNISNTCPIVFWWDNPHHHWKGLFKLNGRGLK